MKKIIVNIELQDLTVVATNEMITFNCNVYINFNSNVNKILKALPHYIETIAFQFLQSKQEENECSNQTK